MNDEWIKAWSAFRTPDSANPWATALDQWWRQTAPADKTDPTYAVFERLLTQGRAFFTLTEPFVQAGDDGAGTDWRRALESALAALKRQFDDPQTASAALWQLPLDHWQRIAPLLNGLPGDYPRSLAGAAGVPAPPEPIERILSAPGVGYTRESQEQYKKLAKLAIDYQQAYQEYTDAYLDMGKESVDLLSARIRERGTPVSSVRELYDLWVETSEEVYGRRVRTPEYAALHGRLINAAMILRHHGSKVMEEFADGLNLPTRTEMDTMHARYQQSRRREHMLHQELKDTQRQLGELRDALGLTGVKGPAKTRPRKRKVSK